MTARTPSDLKAGDEAVTALPVTCGHGLGAWQATGYVIARLTGQVRIAYRHPDQGERIDWFDLESGRRMNDRDENPVRLDLPELAVKEAIHGR